MGEAAEIAKAYFAVVETGDAENARPLLADDYTYTDGSGEVRHGADAAIEVMETYLRAFADLSLEMRHIHEAGNVAVCEFTARGTHTGDLGGIAPTHRRAEVVVCNVLEVRDGRIVAEREYFDQLSMMAQLGLMPENATA